MKGIYLAAILVVIIAVAALGYWGMTGMTIAPEPGNTTCTQAELNYYFRYSCSHCVQVLNEGSLEKLEALGVNVTKYEVVEWGMYGINQVPVFEFGGQRTAGYRSFEELKQLLECG